MNNQLKALLEISQAIRDRDLAELSAKQIRRRGLELARKDLLAQGYAEMDASAKDPLYRKQFEATRKLWRDARIAALAQTEARAAADVEAFKSTAAKSLGRANVLENLWEKARQSKKPKWYD